VGFEGQRILVTGSTGLVGSNLLPVLLQHGASIRATLHHQQPLVPVAGIDYQPCDLLNPEDCARAVSEQNWVVHLAARGSSAAGFNRSPSMEFLDNFFMDARLLEAAQRAGVTKFLWLGSSTAYPPAQDRPIAEDDLFQGEPFEKYYEVGWFKRFTEVLCRIYGTRSTRKMTVGVLRPTAIYGPHDDFDPRTCHVIPALIRKVVQRCDPVEVWGTGDEERDFVYVGDVVEALVLALGRLEEYSAFNIGYGRSCTIREVVETLAALEDFRAEIRFDPSKPTTIPVRRISIERAKQHLGWQPRTNLREGLRLTLDWYRQRTASERSGG
jgi:GDP-L-fucose synthase